MKLELLKIIIERLTENNRYTYIGMDHFARPTKRTNWWRRSGATKRCSGISRRYSTRGNADIYAFGMSAISQDPRRLLAERKGIAGPIHRRPRRGQQAFSAQLHFDRRRQNPARDHHARYVAISRWTSPSCRKNSAIPFQKNILPMNWPHSRPLKRMA